MKHSSVSWWKWHVQNRTASFEFEHRANVYIRCYCLFPLESRKSVAENGEQNVQMHIEN